MIQLRGRRAELPGQGEQPPQAGGEEARGGGAEACTTLKGREFSGWSCTDVLTKQIHREAPLPGTALRIFSERGGLGEKSKALEEGILDILG